MEKKYGRIKSTNTKKKETVTNKFQDQRKYQEKIMILQQ